MPWPSVTDFTEAIQQPNLCFEGSELAQGRPTFHPTRGTPLVYSGNFAAVYPVTSGSRKYAVRCFTSQVEDHQQHYEHLSQYLDSTRPPGFVDFQYQPNGIRIKGEWYPIVRMDWVNGQTLDRYVESQLNDSAALKRIAGKWRETAVALQNHHIAHNDLQHGNVMVQQDGSIRLVDYDGAFLPDFRGSSSPEEGHKNYQHPGRSFKDYDTYVDNFPALVIYLSLLALAATPGLWKSYYNQDNLLITQKDLAAPGDSELFHTLKNNQDPNVAALAAKLEECCNLPVAQVPTLDAILQPPLASSQPPASYRDELLRRRQQGAENEIDCEDFIRFCRKLRGRELKTLSQGAGFRVRVNHTSANLYFTPSSSNVERICPPSEVERFVARYQETKSRSTRDYPTSITANASYLLVLLDNYLQEASPGGGEGTTNTPGTETESYRDLLRRAWTEADELRDNLEQAQRELKTAQSTLHVVQQQAEADKASARKELQALRQQAATEKSKVNRELEGLRSQLQAVQQQADADKTQAEKDIQTAQAKIQEIQRKASHDSFNAHKELQAMQAELKSAVVQCPQCNRDNLGSSAYCYACYAELHSGRQDCSNCGRIVPVKGSFCPGCGFQLV